MWFVDNAGFLQVLLGLIGLGFAAAFYVTRRLKLLGGTAAALAGIVFFWMLTRMVTTDRRQIELNVRAMADAVVAGQPALLIEHLADDFVYAGKDRKALAEYVTKEATRYSVRAIRIWNFSADELSKAEGRARVSFNLSVMDAEGPVFLSGCHAVFVLQNSRWKLKGATLDRGGP